MNFAGNYLAAQAIMTGIEKALPESIQKSRSDPISVLTEDQCARCLAYTAWDRYGIADTVLNRFIKKPPFNTRVYAEAQIQDLEANLARLRRDLTQPALTESASLYAWAIDQRETDWVLHWKYGRLLTEGLKDYRAAARQFQTLRTLLPMSWLSHASLASVLNALGDTQGAIALYERALELNPVSGSTHYYLGDIWHKKGQLDNAASRYREAIEWAPDCIPAYTALMRILMNQKQLDEAVEVGRHGLVYTPDSTALLGSVGTLLARTGHIREAIEAYQAGLKIDPNDASIRNSLKILMEESKGRL
jgi:tetratricopeptide (TPR) repeat protein